MTHGHSTLGIGIIICSGFVAYLAEKAAPKAFLSLYANAMTIDDTWSLHLKLIHHTHPRHPPTMRGPPGLSDLC